MEDVEAVIAAWADDLSLHPPKDAATGQVLDGIREAFIDLGAHVIQVTPAGRERSIALTNLQQACQWAIAAVVCNQN